MLSRISTSFVRHCVARPSALSAVFARSQYTVAEALTADDARKVSGYEKIDYTIQEDASVYDAVQKFAAYNIGCLVVMDAKGNMSGVVSERDYVCKIALLGRTSMDTTVKEIATGSAKLVTVSPTDSVQLCMEKMLSKDIRHLPLVDGDQVVGMISIKDLVKTAVKEKEETIKVLSDFALGKGGHFGSE